MNEKHISVNVILLIRFVQRVFNDSSYLGNNSTPEIIKNNGTAALQKTEMNKYNQYNIDVVEYSEKRKYPFMPV